MRVLHVADRWTDRGGAYHYLASLVSRQLVEHDVALRVGRRDRASPAPCPVTCLSGLDARDRRPVDWPPVECDAVHLHNVVNPEALERIGRLDVPEKRVTIQDHRFFCPGRGKLTSDARVCREPMSAELCRDCFVDESYFRQTQALTEERLRALAPFEIEVLSRYMKRELTAVGVPAARITLAPPEPGLVGAETLERSRPPSVLFVGRLVEAKGVWDAVEAWTRSRVRLPLVFAGTGPLRDELERRGFEVLGWLPRERMPALYRSAAAVLMPSRWQEPFGIAGLEAQTLGTPVVAWESGAVVEWHRGPRVKWGDVDALARELRRVCGSARPTRASS